uniref:TLK2 n=1 Tax=Arundo donax TaxID=35708 RepID=A0A0A9G9J0_ARUDO
MQLYPVTVIILPVKQPCLHCQVERLIWIPCSLIYLLDHFLQRMRKSKSVVFDQQSLSHGLDLYQHDPFHGLAFFYLSCLWTVLHP